MKVADLGGAAAVAKGKGILSSLETVLLAESLGGVESLITHPATMTTADIPPEEQAEVGLTPSLVRLSVGVEHVEDLAGDLAQALRKAASGK